MLPYVLFSLLLVLTIAIVLFPVRRQCGFLVVSAALLFCGTLGLYHFTGTPAIIAAVDLHNQKLAEAREVIATESEKLKTNDKNLESWIRLGQAFAQSAKWAEAARAFKQTVLLSGGQPDLIMAYARSLIMADEGNVSDHAKESLQMVLIQKPDHEEARYYMAVRLLQDGNTKEAMSAMKALYKTLADESPVKAMIDQQIGRR